jgi:hypothetical protein
MLEHFPYLEICWVKNLLFWETIRIFFPIVGYNTGKKLVVCLDWEFYVNFPKLGKIMEHKNIFLNSHVGKKFPFWEFNG